MGLAWQQTALFISTRDTELSLWNLRRMRFELKQVNSSQQVTLKLELHEACKLCFLGKSCYS